MSLRKKTIKGLTWSGISQAGKQISQFVITAILARLLSPDDFGLLGMAVVFTGFASIFNEMGVTGALIQKQDAEERHYSSVFWLNIAAGIILMLLMIAISPLIAKFYNKPELQPILAVISISFVIASFGILQKTIFTKEMDFKKLAIVETIAVICAGVVGIYFAYTGHGVWSLVYQTLTFTFVNMLLLWVFSKWRPKFIFSITAIKDIFHFSANLTGFNIVNYFARNVDKLLIGKFLGAQALGFYTLAYKLMLYPLQNISSVIGRVMFPAFSKIQHDLEKVRKAYLKMVKAISLVTFPMMVSLFAVTPEFVNVVFGPKWEPGILLIRILCFCGIIQAVGTTVGNIRLSQGKSRLHLKIGLLNAALTTCIILVSLKWGVYVVAISYTLFSWGWYHFSAYVSLKIIDMPLKDFIRKLAVPYFLSTCLLIFLLIAKNTMQFLSLCPRIMMTLLLGFVFYMAVLLLTKQITFVNEKRVHFNI